MAGNLVAGQMSVLKLDDASPEAEEYFIDSEKLIEGNPKQSVWLSYSDPTEKFFVGTWASEVGKWKISYTEEEYCEILEGENVITNQDGSSLTVTAGDIFVVPSGFSGTWEVVKPTKKKFVIYEK